MDTSSGAHRTQGMVAGSLIALVFGVVFVMANTARLGGGWTIGVRVAGVAVALALLVAVLRRRRAAAPAAAPPGPPWFTDRAYLTIVGIEAVALFGGLFVLNRLLGITTLNIAWIALVVGTHFFALGRVWRLPLFHGLGAAMVVLAVAGAALHAAGAGPAAVDLVAGVGSGAALFATVAAALVLDARPDTAGARAHDPA
jgi:hypothetical protein